jgi:hypothetical protein
MWEGCGKLVENYAGMASYCRNYFFGFWKPTFQKIVEKYLPYVRNPSPELSTGCVDNFCARNGRFSQRKQQAKAKIWGNLEVSATKVSHNTSKNLSYTILPLNLSRAAGLFTLALFGRTESSPLFITTNDASGISLLTRQLEPIKLSDPILMPGPMPV